MIDTAPKGNPNLLEMLAARARRASDGRLVSNAIAGMLVSGVAIWRHGPGWTILTAFAACFLCFGVWGIVDRELGERPDSARRSTTMLRAVRLAAGVLGFAAAGYLALAVLGGLLGRMIS